MKKNNIPLDHKETPTVAFQSVVPISEEDLKKKKAREEIVRRLFYKPLSHEKLKYRICWTIYSSVCCLPIGIIVGILYFLVNKIYREAAEKESEKMLKDAERKSMIAERLGFLAIVLGGVCFLAAFVLFLVFGFSLAF